LTGSVLAAKRIELLHELVPKTAALIALMVNPTIPPPAEPQPADAETAARSRPGVVFAELGFPPTALPRAVRSVPFGRRIGPCLRGDAVG
jgi:hypothetical protein